MATSCTAHSEHEMPLLDEMISYLEYQSRPVPNDQRQINYCEYITRFCFHYHHGDPLSQEGCVVVGSTREGIRLRREEDDGDFDYLGYSWIRIPTELLEVNQQFPCYVHIRGTKEILDQFEGTIVFSPDGYLQSSVLKEVHEKAFPILKEILDVVSAFESIKGKHRLHLKLKSDIDPGIKKVTFTDWKCDELNEIPKRAINDTAMTINILRNLHRKFPKLMEDILSRINLFKDFLVEICGKIGVPLQDADDTRMVSLIKDYFFPFMESFGSMIVPKTDNSTQHSMVSMSPSLTIVNKRAVSRVKQTRSIAIQFCAKASKDFIPAFRLTRTPDCIESWCKIQHKWPSAECIDKIKDCSYFVVAKSCVKDPKPEIDFCFGFNEAERLLAHALLPVERKCLLVLKAFMKKTLEKDAEKLTTFHWKTAMYRVLQDIYDGNRALQHAVYTPENVMSLVQEVVEYMTDCWCDGELLHFFCGSNLLAKFEEDELYEVGSSLVSLQQNLSGALREYIRDSFTSSDRTEYIHDVDGVKEAFNENHEALVEEAVVKLISKLVETDGEDKLLEVLLDVCDQAIPFIKQEMEGYEDRDEVTEDQISQDVFNKLKEIVQSQ